MSNSIPGNSNSFRLFFLGILFLSFSLQFFGQTTLPGESLAPQKKEPTAKPVTKRTKTPKSKGSVLLTFDTDGELKIDGESKGVFGSDDIWKGELSAGAHVITYSNGTDVYKEILTTSSGHQEIVEIELVPVIVKRDPLYMLTTKAEKGDVEAMYNLAKKYKESKNSPKALMWYERACLNDHPNACQKAGYYCNDDSLAVKYFKRGAELGDRWAMANYSIVLVDGKGCKKNYNEAFIWAQQVASLALESEGFLFTPLAQCYYFGYGTPRSYPDALVYIQKGINGNNPYSYYLAGEVYENGYGVIQNSSTAIKFYKTAASKGNSYAIKRLNELGVSWE